MTYVLVALLCTAAGYFIGVAMVTTSLREDLELLRYHQANIAQEKAKVAAAVAATREAEEGKRLLGARLIQTHIDHATHSRKGWLS